MIAKHEVQYILRSKVSKEEIYKPGNHKLSSHNNNLAITSTSYQTDIRGIFKPVIQCNHWDKYLWKICI